MYCASFQSLIMLMASKNKSPFGQTSMMFNKGRLLTLSHPSKQIVAPYLWIEFLILSTTCLDKFSKWNFSTILFELNDVQWRFIKYFPLRGELHCIIEGWMVGYIQWEVGFIKEGRPLLVKILFHG